MTDTEKERKEKKKKESLRFFGYFSELQVLEHRVGEVLISFVGSFFILFFLKKIYFFYYYYL